MSSASSSSSNTNTEPNTEPEPETATETATDEPTTAAPDRERIEGGTVIYVCRVCGGRAKHFVPDPDAMEEMRIEPCLLCERIAPMDRTEVL